MSKQCFAKATFSALFNSKVYILQLCRKVPMTCSRKELFAIDILSFLQHDSLCSHVFAMCERCLKTVHPLKNLRSSESINEAMTLTEKRWKRCSF